MKGNETSCSAEGSSIGWHTLIFMEAEGSYSLHCCMVDWVNVDIGTISRVHSI